MLKLSRWSLIPESRDLVVRSRVWFFILQDGLLLGEWFDRLLLLAFGVTPTLLWNSTMAPDGGPDET